MNDRAADAAVNVAVRLSGVSKAYRLYQQPLYRFLDLFGLCPTGPGYYTTHHALADINLEIGRGEKTAIIGRNGAGKSTMLKIITGLVQPTKGSVQVDGQISNLLQIGSGFHPDFTGRQNIFANLAHQGVVGRTASEMFDRIVDFSEIHEYIDQPMKTYSTGMCSRLMFSSAVTMAPDILIVDEILGVGDAYFAHKSFERMRELSSSEGTTLLLVTHDVSSALNLCDRFIWIDKGRVMFDGDGRAAISLYDSSIKTQEEQALRQRNAVRFASGASRGDGSTAAGSAVAGATILHVLVRSRTGFALQSPLALERLELAFEDGSRTMVDVADGAAAWALVAESNLGPPETVAHRRCRTLRAAGSIYHKAEWSVSVPAGTSPVASLRLGWHYRGTDLVDVRVFTPDHQVIIAGELGAAKEWQDATFVQGREARQQLDPQKQMDYGTGLVRIVSIRFLDANGDEVVDVAHGAYLTVSVRVRVAAELLDRHVTFVLGFWRQGSAYLGTVYERNLLLPDAEECVIEATLDPVQFGSGPWYLNVGIGAPHLYDQPELKYFAIDPSWYHLLAGWIQLRVTSAHGADAHGCFVMHPASVRCVPASTPSQQPQTPAASA
jgi:ABC-type polysaccharide/polyol phosphate transport system ATPase subunit